VQELEPAPEVELLPELEPLQAVCRHVHPDHPRRLPHRVGLAGRRHFAKFLKDRVYHPQFSVPVL